MILGLLATAAAVITLAAAPAGAQQGALAASATEGGDLWFVELVGKPEAEGRAKADVRANKDACRRAADAEGVKYRVRRSFDVLFDGASVQATAAERARLARLPGFKARDSVELIRAPKPKSGAVGSAPDERRTSADIMLAAMQQTLHDCKDAVNMRRPVAPVAPVPDRGGRRPAVQEGRGRRGLDRQQRPAGQRARWQRHRGRTSGGTR